MSNPRRQLLITAAFALIGAVVGIAGTGHAYLRRWRRSALWFLLTIGASIALTSVYVSDPAALDTQVLLSSPIEIAVPVYPPEVVIPVLVIIGFSIVDALLVAFLDQREAEMAPGVGPDADEADVGVSCPHCGRATDPELDFCTWCTESLPTPETHDPN